MYNIQTAPTPLTLPLLPSPTLPSPPALPAVVSSRCLVPFTQLALLEELPIFGIARRPLQRKVSWTHHSLPEHKTSTTSSNTHTHETSTTHTNTHTHKTSTTRTNAHTHTTSTTSTNAHFNVQAASFQKGNVTHASKANHAKGMFCDCTWLYG